MNANKYAYYIYMSIQQIIIRIQIYRYLYIQQTVQYKTYLSIQYNTDHTHTQQMQSQSQTQTQITKSTISQIPPQILSGLKKYEAQIQPSLKNNINQLPKWFIANVLNYTDINVPRLELLCWAEALVKSIVPDQKCINSLFLEEDSIINLIQESKCLPDIGFVLFKHLELKVMTKDINYADSILTVTKTKVEEILRQNQQKLQTVFGVAEVDSFIQQKRRLPDSLYLIDKFQKQHMEKEVVIIFNYVFKPLFEKRSLQKVYDCLYPMILWFVVLRDNTPQKELTLMNLAKKIDSFLWIKKVSTNVHLINTFNNVLDLLSVKYLKQDSFSYQTLAPLIIKIKHVPYSDLVGNWVITQRDKKGLPKLIQNILRNTLNTGCTIFCFIMIDCFTRLLQNQKNYEGLFYIFDSFIRKEYLSIKLPDGTFVKDYLKILMTYVVGFMNRDRLDGETELDRLALNLSETVCRPNFKYDNCYMEIIKFFRIYENRFQFLSNTCKNFVSSLEQIYRYTPSVTELHQQVANRIFKQYSADYEEGQIYSLQRSYRYAGLDNLGNTCYMNSFMQALFMTKKFKSLVIKAQDEGVVPTNHPIFQSLMNLFGQLSSKTGDNRTDVNPVDFKKFIPQPFKSSWEQHDSGQFGRMFLDSVTTQLKDTPLSDKIDKLFTHQLQSKIICKGCNRQRDRKQKMFDFILSVDQSTPDAITISDLLKSFFKGYELDDNNMVKCEICKANRPAFVKPEPLELAQYLIATVSIFKYDIKGSSKINKPLNFQFSINFKNILPKIVTADDIYELYAFVLHIGTGVERGHYQCFARNLQQNPMLWYKFDDHYVTEQEINQIDDFHFGQNETPYILFYTSSSKMRRSFIK